MNTVYWIPKNREQMVIRIIEWAQRHDVRLKDMSTQLIREALKQK